MVGRTLGVRLRRGAVAGERVQVGALHVVELQSSAEGFEHGVGHPGKVAAFEPGVVLDADAGELRDLRPT